MDGLVEMFKYEFLIRKMFEVHYSLRKRIILRRGPTLRPRPAWKAPRSPGWTQTCVDLEPHAPNAEVTDRSHKTQALSENFKPNHLESNKCEN